MAGTIQSIVPSFGTELGNMDVVITVQDYTTINSIVSVKFGGVDALSFNSPNSTTINAVTPPGTGIVDVSVTYAGFDNVSGTADDVTKVLRDGFEYTCSPLESDEVRDIIKYWPQVLGGLC